MIKKIVSFIVMLLLILVIFLPTAIGHGESVAILFLIATIWIGAYLLVTNLLNKAMLRVRTRGEQDD